MKACSVIASGLITSATSFAPVYLEKELNMLIALNTGVTV